MLIDSQCMGMNNYDYYSPAIRSVLEDHLTYFRNHSTTRYQNIDPGIAYRFEGDFYGLMTYYNVDYYLHWLILRMNGMTEPSEMTADRLLYLYPDPNVVSQVLSVEKTSGRLTG